MVCRLCTSVMCHDGHCLSNSLSPSSCVLWVFPCSLGVSSIPEVFQYDLTALYATEENNSETKTSDSQAVGTPLDSETRTRGLVRMNSMGEVAVRCVILVATDGLYDMMSNDDAVVIAFKHWGDPAAAAEEMIVETGQSKYITMHLVPQDALYWRFACVLTNRITHVIIFWHAAIPHATSLLSLSHL
jgi:hypothetical protein